MFVKISNFMPDRKAAQQRRIVEEIIAALVKRGVPRKIAEAHVYREFGVEPPPKTAIVV